MPRESVIIVWIKQEITGIEESRRKIFGVEGEEVISRDGYSISH